MLRGADTTILNYEGMSAYELADEIQSKSLQQEVKKMLGPPGKLDCLMLSPPTRLIHKKPTTLIWFMILFMLV